MITKNKSKGVVSVNLTIENKLEQITSQKWWMGRKADTWALREDKRYAVVLQEGSEVADTRRLSHGHLLTWLLWRGMWLSVAMIDVQNYRYAIALRNFMTEKNAA